MTEADVDTIERLLLLEKDAALHARLADILWLRRTSAHQAAKASIDDYITAAQNLLQPQSLVFSVELIEALEHPLAQTEPFFANHFLQLILALFLGDAKTMADIAKFHAELPLLNDDPERRRGYLLLEADFRQAQGDTAREAEARLLAGETYVEEAEDKARRNPPSYLAARSSLAKGIEALRKRLPPRQIIELRRRLKDRFRTR